MRNSTVTSLQRFGESRVWIATTDATYLFDGASLKRFEVPWDDGFSHPRDRVLLFIEADDRTTFIASSDNKIFRKRQSEDSFEALNDIDGWLGDAKVDVAVMAKDPLGALAIRDDYLSFFDATRVSGTEVALHSDAEALPIALALGAPSEAFVFDTTGRSTRLIWSDRSGWQQSTTSYCDARELPVGVVVRSKNDTYFGIGEKGALVKFRVTQKTCEQMSLPKEIQKQLEDKTLLKIHVLSKTGSLAIATDKGVIFVTNSVVETLDTSNSRLRSNEVTSILELSDGHVLIASFLGVVQAAQLGLVTVTRFGTTQRPEVTAIDSDPKRGVYLTSYDSVAQVTENAQGIQVSPVEVPPHTGGFSAIAVSKGHLAIGTTSGEFHLLPFDPQQQNCFIDSQDSEHGPVTDIAKLDQARFIATTLSGELFLIEECERFVLKRGNDLVENAERASLISIARIAERLHLFDFWGAYPIDLIFQADRAPIPKLVAGSEPLRNVWIRTVHGSSEYAISPDGRLEEIVPNGSLQVRVPRQLALNETVFSSETDKQKRAWLTTSSGLFLLDEHLQPVRVLGASSLGGISFDYGASHATSTGSLFFGGTGGFVMAASPSRFPIRRDGLIRILSIRIDEVSTVTDNIYETLEVVTRAPIGSLSVTLGTQLTPVVTELQIAAELIEPDGSRRVIEGDSEFTFSVSGPGNYTFQARGVDPLGVWSNNEIVIPITVLPPVWQSWWAYTLYFSLLAFSMLVFVKVRDGIVRNRIRLDQAIEDQAALARLEDTAQEQQEATERLLNSIKPRAMQLLGSVSTAIEGGVRDPASAESDEFRLLSKRLRALEKLELLAVHSSLGGFVNVYELVDELIAQAASAGLPGGDAILLNDCSEVDIPVDHARFLALTADELLTLMLSRDHGGASHIVRIEVTPQPDAESAEETYFISVEDREHPVVDDHEAEAALPMTMHLIESLGGRLSLESELGLKIRVELRLT